MWGGDFQGILPWGGPWPHLPLPQHLTRFGWGAATLPQVVALVGTLIVQLAGQAGHHGSELHRLQGRPDGFV